MKIFISLTAYGDCGHELVGLGDIESTAKRKFVDDYGHIAGYRRPKAVQDLDRAIQRIEDESSYTDEEQAWFQEFDTDCLNLIVPTTNEMEAIEKMADYLREDEEESWEEEGKPDSGHIYNEVQIVDGLLLRC